jgi:hypothetical protein
MGLCYIHSVTFYEGDISFLGIRSECCLKDECCPVEDDSFKKHEQSKITSMTL